MGRKVASTPLLRLMLTFSVTQREIEARRLVNAFYNWQFGEHLRHVKMLLLLLEC